MHTMLEGERYITLEKDGGRWLVKIQEWRTDYKEMPDLYVSLEDHSLGDIWVVFSKGDRPHFFTLDGLRSHALPKWRVGEHDIKRPLPSDLIGVWDGEVVAWKVRFYDMLLKWDEVSKKGSMWPLLDPTLIENNLISIPLQEGKYLEFFSNGTWVI